MIQQIRIQNFRSLKDVTLDLQQVNLLIGPNNSGKTNVLKALVFLGQFITAKQLLISDNEFTNIHFGKNWNRDMAWLSNDVIFKIVFSYGQKLFYYRISFQEPDSYTGLIGLLKNEEVYDQNDLLCVGNVEQDLSIYFEEYNKLSERGIIATEGEVIDTKQHSKISNFIYSNLKSVFFNAVIYKPDPTKFFIAASVASNTVLNDDASNIVPFLFSLSQNHKKKFRQLEEDLKHCVGDIVSISTPPDPAENGKLKLKFFDAYDNDYWADEVSEGVLYFLAILCIIHQPDPPKLLLLEEPEKGIHPRRIREVMDFIFDLAQDKNIQVIMTTHDTYVVDQFADIPEAVFVFDKKDGATEVKNLQKDVIEPANQLNEENGLPPTNYTRSLGEHWAAGFLGGVPR